MTSFSITPFDFTETIDKVAAERSDLRNWPVVYVLNSPPSTTEEQGYVYFGETLNFSARMRQHWANEDKRNNLRTARVIVHEEFNKSACLDLESFLIKHAAGDGSHEVMNRNTGVVDSDYFDRERYTTIFQDIFQEMLEEGVFQRSIPEIVNSELFKLSPFKSLNHDQAIAVVDIMEGLIQDLQNESQLGNLLFIEGDPGTGKTVVAIYLMKLMQDIGDHRDVGEVDADTIFSEFFLEDTRRIFQDKRIALVVPQQSLRKSIGNVFERTPGLRRNMVMTPHQVAKDPGMFDVVIVDEAHRLNQRSNQNSGPANTEFIAINQALFGDGGELRSQLDWLRAKSRHVILMLDLKQTVRPQDIPREEYEELLAQFGEKKKYRLHTQMRSQGGNDYIQYIYDVLSPAPPTKRLNFGEYEVGLVDSPARLHELILERNEQHGLARMVAGYAWPWVSKNKKSAIDIDLGPDAQFQWNTTDVDWVNSSNAVNEIGSIHTVQGYDLNYAGVIIGGDLRYDPDRRELIINRANYFDKKGKENNKLRDRPTTDELLKSMILNIYAVLLTRGIKGTFIHVTDPALREYLGQFFRVID